MEVVDPDRSIEEQIEYYRRRATEYDETSRPPGDPLHDQGESLIRELHAFEPRGRVLEIACGTGSYTGELVRFADEVTALDSSPEMIEGNRSKVRSPRVGYVAADVFSWEPDGTYDVVFFSFWLSHVPPTHFERFWELTERCLGPGGRVFFMDEGRHVYWREEFVDEDAGVVRRELRDGTEHRAVKVLWDPEELRSRLGELGWEFEVGSTGAFYWGKGRRSEGR